MPTARGWVAPKRWRSSASRKPKGDAAVERAAGGEGDQQPLGPVGIADRGARLGADLAEPLLERGDPAGDFRVDHDLLGLAGVGGRAAEAEPARRRGAVRTGWGAAAGGAAGATPITRAAASHCASSQPIAPRPSRKARPGMSSRPQSERPPRRRRHSCRPVRNRRSSRASFASLAQLGGKLQQGLVARRRGDRDRLPAGAGRRGGLRR